MTTVPAKQLLIRYNTASDGETDRWRLICDGVQHLADDIEVTAPLRSTKDWMEATQEWKYHVSCQNVIVELTNKPEGGATLAVISPS